MNQTAPVNLALMPSFGKPKRSLYILLIVLAAGLGIGGYFLQASLQPQKAPPVSTTAQEKVFFPAGFTRAQELIAAGGNLVGRSAFQISYNGVLTAQDPDKSWILKKGGKTVTIAQEGSQKVNYSRVAAPNTPAQQIRASDLKTGDDVTLVVLVNTKTGLVTVTNITIAPKPGTQATPSASPATQKP